MCSQHLSGDIESFEVTSYQTTILSGILGEVSSPDNLSSGTTDEFPMAAITNYYNTNLLLQFWRSFIQNGSHGAKVKVLAGLKTLGENVSLSFPTQRDLSHASSSIFKVSSIASSNFL